MKEKLHRIQRLSRQRLEDLEAISQLQSIREDVSDPPQKPFRSQGVQFNEEGIETPLIASEEMQAGFSLPAQTLRWNFKPAKYRVVLELAEAGHVDAIDEKSGEKIMRGRQVVRHAVLTLEAGKVRLESTKPIQRISIYRFNAQSGGEIVLGPYQAEGIVEAKAIGNGNWTAEVASEPMIGGEFSAGESPSFSHSGQIWPGTRPGKDQPDRPNGDLWRGVVADRLPGGPDLSLDFYEAVRAGRVPQKPEILEVDQPTRAEGDLVWRQLGKYQLLSGREAPAFDPTPAFWTHLWGRAEAGVSRAYQLKSGAATDASTRGQYLIRTNDPESVEVEGAVSRHAAEETEGGAATAGRNMLMPGRHAQADVDRAPNRVFIRLSGKGTARAIEITETTLAGPQGIELSSSRRIDLAGLFEPGRNPGHNPSSEGLGKLLADT